jgi:hypothetical protein
MRAPSLSVDLFGSAAVPEGRDIVSYHWDPGDGTTTDGPAVTYVFDQPGRYTARLIATERGHPRLDDGRDHCDRRQELSLADDRPGPDDLTVVRATAPLSPPRPALHARRDVRVLIRS